jgi:hypothetical protein
LARTAHRSSRNAKGLGTAIAGAGKPVMLTFAHEFNVSGQYPWAQGDCEGTTPAQWITAWDAVRNDVDSAANGYPQSEYGETTFANTFADTFSIIRGLSGETTIAKSKIFVAETDFAPLDTSRYESISSMVSDICSNGGDGTLQFEDGTPSLSSAQWSELDPALAGDCSSGPVNPTKAPTTAPNAPTRSRGTTTYVKWNLPSADTQPADKWSYFELILYGCDDKTVQHDSKVTVDSVTMYLAPAGTRYFKVRVCNSIGCSAYSPTTKYANRADATARRRPLIEGVKNGWSARTARQCPLPWAWSLRPDFCSSGLRWRCQRPRRTWRNT